MLLTELYENTWETQLEGLNNKYWQVGSSLKGRNTWNLVL